MLSSKINSIDMEIKQASQARNNLNQQKFNLRAQIEASDESYFVLREAEDRLKKKASDIEKEKAQRDTEVNYLKAKYETAKEEFFESCNALQSIKTHYENCLSLEDRKRKLEEAKTFLDEIGGEEESADENKVLRTEYRHLFSQLEDDQEQRTQENAVYEREIAAEKMELERWKAYLEDMERAMQAEADTVNKLFQQHKSDKRIKVLGFH